MVLEPIFVVNSGALVTLYPRFRALEKMDCQAQPPVAADLRASARVIVSGLPPVERYSRRPAGFRLNSAHFSLFTLFVINEGNS